MHVVRAGSDPAAFRGPNSFPAASACVGFTQTLKPGSSPQAPGLHPGLFSPSLHRDPIFSLLMGLQTALDLILQPEGRPPTAPEAAGMLRNVARDAGGMVVAASWVQQHWQALQARGGGYVLLPGVDSHFPNIFQAHQTMQALMWQPGT